MLRQYCKEYDEDNKVFKDKPRHDWSSHGADAFRTAMLQNVRLHFRPEMLDH